MGKTNTEGNMAEIPAQEEKREGLQMDVRVRPIAPMGNLLAFGNVTIGDALRLTGSVSVPGIKGCTSICPLLRTGKGTGRMSAIR